MISDALLNAMRSLQGSAPATDKEEMGEVPGAPDEPEGHAEKMQEKLVHHRRMMRVAGSPAARALHAKLKAHYQLKLQ